MRSMRSYLRIYACPLKKWLFAFCSAALHIVLDFLSSFYLCFLVITPIYFAFYHPLQSLNDSFQRKKYYYHLTNKVYRSSPSHTSSKISTNARTNFFYFISLIFHLYSHPRMYSKPAAFDARFQKPNLLAEYLYYYFLNGLQ